MRYFLQRFINAQDFGIYEKALQEVKNGRKMSHWIWFIFPCIRGLGHSQKTQYYSIKSLDEARAYLKHPVLGSRLREIIEAMLSCGQSDAGQIFGIDYVKVASCLTLFDYISPNDIFGKAIDKMFAGSRHPQTLSQIYALNKTK